MLNNLYFPYFLINKITAIMALTYLKKYKNNINLKTWNIDIINPKDIN